MCINVFAGLEKQGPDNRGCIVLDHTFQERIILNPFCIVSIMTGFHTAGGGGGRALPQYCEQAHSTHALVCVHVTGGLGGMPPRNFFFF